MGKNAFLMETMTQMFTCRLAERQAQLRHGPDRGKVAWPMGGNPPVMNLAQAQGLLNSYISVFETKLTSL